MNLKILEVNNGFVVTPERPDYREITVDCWVFNTTKDLSSFVQSFYKDKNEQKELQTTE